MFVWRFKQKLPWFPSDVFLPHLPFLGLCFLILLSSRPVAAWLFPKRCSLCLAPVENNSAPLSPDPALREVAQCVPRAIQIEMKSDNFCHSAHAKRKLWNFFERYLILWHFLSRHSIDNSWCFWLGWLLLFPLLSALFLWWLKMWVDKRKAHSLTTEKRKGKTSTVRRHESLRHLSQPSHLRTITCVVCEENV